jgi:uncharacterized ferritin-like protein (DUF455 family)
MNNLFNAAARCLTATELEDKLSLTGQFVQTWREGLLSLESQSEPEPIGEPGRPIKPVLVKFSGVPKRGVGAVKGRAALIHAVTHIEFNAINLALDAVYRFRDLPVQFYADWIRVADEEVSHFRLLRKRLNELGFDYGDFSAHGGLWDMAKRTAHDPMVRMALVPRTLEARGLDVMPGIMDRFRQVGDGETFAALEVILRDEVGHVEIGSRWFKYFCEQRELNFERTFRDLVDKYFFGQLRGPFHYEARQKAGFTVEELQSLERPGSG